MRDVAHMWRQLMLALALTLELGQKVSVILLVFLVVQELLISPDMHVNIFDHFVVYWKPIIAIVVFLSGLLPVGAVEPSLGSVISLRIFLRANLTLCLRMNLDHPVLAEIFDSTVLL